ncbi:hypothetical protein AQJ67_27020 [Streptomyces caeruleatus]|uniref:Uncharacterized protein n=1 Tax=Streptomyces caeruleatus TaxID=661399 RepID=A0A117RMK0_9ACTN|nr:hypothetical protein AQJ67_27020 [Streptomyces caeruleatus]
MSGPEVHAKIQAYEDLLAKHGLKPGEAALAWLPTRCLFVLLRLFRRSCNSSHLAPSVTPL